MMCYSLRCYKFSATSWGAGSPGPPRLRPTGLAPGLGVEPADPDALDVPDVLGDPDRPDRR